MDWVKRNLYFVVGSVVALVLMAAAGWYLWSGWKSKTEVFEKLGQAYADLKGLYDLNPNPGNEKINNIKAAKEQQEQVRVFLREAAGTFIPVPRIPNPEGTNQVTSEEFTAQLRRTVDQLQRDATNASVTIPANYNFSFEAQKSLMTFAPGSLDVLAVQLGEVKVICDALFSAKVNALDSVRRERVSNDDYKGPPADYLNIKSVTNDLAIITPYEVTFRCFSPELAGVLNSFQASPYCLLVKTVDVDPGTGGPSLLEPGAPGMPGELTPGLAARYGIPMTPQPDAAAAAAAMQRRYGLPMNPSPEAPPAAEAFARRYGAAGGGPQNRYGGGGLEGRYGGGASLGGIPYRPLGTTDPGMTPAYVPRAYAPPAYPTVTPGVAPGRGGLQNVLDEKPLRVIMMIHVVKLLPKERVR